MAKAVYVQKGDIIDYTAGKATGYLDVVTLTTRVGVALEDIAKGATGSVALTGVYELPAASSLAIAVGDALYWNAENSSVDKTDTGIPAGMAVSPKTAAGASVRVRIG